ncbi:hypothetical protein FQN55_002122 [Onygenales sp. PD_40]|nr:hypothetical protein FQN55_002122 [Onygenales sp. PD_40]
MSSTTTRTLYRRSGEQYPKHLSVSQESITITRPLDVLIKVHAVSLNYRDFNMLRGTNPWLIKEDGIPGSDAAGEVIGVGEGVVRFKIGDRVCPNLDQKNITGTEDGREWLGGEVDGVLATHVIFPEDGLVKIPAHLSWAEAACLPCAALTAWSGLNTQEKHITAADSVLLQGTGGVSILALKLAAQAGATILLTSSSDAKLTQAQSLISSQQNSKLIPINSRTQPDWEEAALAHTAGRGVDVVLDNGGAQTLMQSLKAVRQRGMISQIGYLGEQDGKYLEGVVAVLIDKAVNWRGVNCGSRLDFEDLIAFVENHQMRFNDIIDKTFKFEEAEAAIQYLGSGAHLGKVVIEVL